MNKLNNGYCGPQAPPGYKKCIWFDYCSIPEFTLEGKIPPQWKKFYCDVGSPFCKRYQMENLGRYIPDNMLPDGIIRKHLNRFED